MWLNKSWLLLLLNFMFYALFWLFCDIFVKLRWLTKTFQNPRLGVKSSKIRDMYLEQNKRLCVKSGWYLTVNRIRDFIYYIPSIEFILFASQNLS